MLKKIQSFIIENQLLEYEKTVIVAISGGADSVALWFVLRELGYQCALAHCNFHLRGEESNRDEEFVRQLAKKHETPFYKIDFDTKKYAKEQGISIEMAARDLRYNWFYHLIVVLDAQAIAVAHHADDNIETILMNLMRGCGLKGLRGIPVKNEKVVRPLLCCSRKEIEQYLLFSKQNYVNDSTNKLNDHRRNKIRNQIIPLLEEINPVVRQVLYDASERYADAFTIYDEKIESIKAEVVSKETNGLKINIDKLKKQPAYKTVLFEILQPFGFRSLIVKKIAESLEKESGKQFYSETHCLLKDRDQLIVFKIQQEENDKLHYPISENTKTILTPISMQFGKKMRLSDFQLSKEKNCVQFDYDKLIFPLTLRKWCKGDVFHPFGLKGKKKKLSDFFIDNKLSLLEKKSCWLLLSGNEIVWIVGYQTDYRFRVTDKTKDILQIDLIDQ